jgi:hypothetical protein
MNHDDVEHSADRLALIDEQKPAGASLLAVPPNFWEFEFF